MALDSTNWKYTLMAMDGTTPQGAGEVVNAHDRTYAEPLNGARSASFALELDHPKIDYLLTHDCLLKVMRRDRTNIWTTLLIGDVISTEEQGQQGSGHLIVTASDPFVRLQKRLIGMNTDANGKGTGFKVGELAVPVDLSLALQLVLQEVNAQFYCGINAGTIALCGTASVVGPLYSVFAGTAIQDICSTLGGPDFWISPYDPPTGTMPNVVIGNFNCQSTRGTTRPLAIFEYGCGKHNVDTYNRVRTKQNACNYAASPPQGWPTSMSAGDVMQAYGDAASQNAMSRFDDILTGDIASGPLRLALCQENGTMRKQWQQQITFQPSADNPVEYGVDYNVGDIVTARAFDVTSGKWRYNGTARVYGVQFTIDDNGKEQETLTLVPGG